MPKVIQETQENTFVLYYVKQYKKPYISHGQTIIDYYVAFIECPLCFSSLARRHLVLSKNYIFLID